MFRNGILGLALGMLAAAPAGADPVGNYRAVIGTPGEATALEGRVTVTRMEESYRVVWKFGGKAITGVALGGAFNRGDLIIGPAHPDDLMLVIGFRNGKEYGSATMILQVDGSYQGFRVSSHSGKALPEQWKPIR